MHFTALHNEMIQHWYCRNRSKITSESSSYPQSASRKPSCDKARPVLLNSQPGAQHCPHHKSTVDVDKLCILGRQLRWFVSDVAVNGIITSYYVRSVILQVCVFSGWIWPTLFNKFETVRRSLGVSWACLTLSLPLDHTVFLTLSPVWSQE